MRLGLSLAARGGAAEMFIANISTNNIRLMTGDAKFRPRMIARFISVKITTAVEDKNTHYWVCKIESHSTSATCGLKYFPIDRHRREGHVNFSQRCFSGALITSQVRPCAGIFTAISAE